MKKLFFAAVLITGFTSCKLWSVVEKNCSTELTYSNNRSMICAVCDSTTGSDLFNALKHIKK